MGAPPCLMMSTRYSSERRTTSPSARLPGLIKKSAARHEPRPSGPWHVEQSPVYSRSADEAPAGGRGVSRSQASPPVKAPIPARTIRSASSGRRMMARPHRPQDLTTRSDRELGLVVEEVHALRVERQPHLVVVLHAHG